MCVVNGGSNMLTTDLGCESAGVRGKFFQSRRVFESFRDKMGWERPRYLTPSKQNRKAFLKSGCYPMDRWDPDHKMGVTGTRD